ncbi:helix-turn-helix domain-containing protein [Amycolatopsis sp. WAC 04182]|uniref:helix-turn-helix domain-containing protein n=1 Tax=Amycolatopsis sp. WAC 04182 TaxID=2203198 RepID=UPI001F1575E8|nr:helix-turn-helix domain-containing protein [Amycolatopsis sp. WAC 04182]
MTENSGSARSGETGKARPVSTAALTFGRALRQRRQARGLALRDLQKLAYVDKSLISRVERGLTPPSAEFAEACDRALGAGGALIVLAEAARAEPYVHLPPPPDHFVGRAEHLALLDEKVFTEAAKVVFVAGPPGVGKTALVLNWANRRQEEFDCVLWSDLRGYAAGSPAQPADILDDLLRCVGVRPDRVPAEEHMRLALLRGLLRGQRTLVVLDNALDSHQVRPVLPGTPDTTVLITSRRRLSGLVVGTGAVQVSLEPLQDLEAARLMADLIGDERAAGDPEGVGRLVRLCAALPLAVSIAAERVATHPHQSVGDLARELVAEGQRLELLAVDDDAVGVRAAFSWSYRALEVDTARLFRLLGLHPGPRFTAGAAAALAGLPEHDARRLLDKLVHAHLVQQIGARYYRFHDLLRVYAAEEAAAAQWRDERKAAVSRLTHWYLYAANAASWTLTPARDHHIDLGPAPDGVEPLRFATFDEAYIWCASEMPSITGVARLALDHGLYEIGWRLPVELFDYHLLGRPWQTWISSHEVAIESAEAGGDLGGLAWSAINLAEAHRRRGDLDRARDLFGRAVELAEEIGENPSLGWALVGLGNIAHEREDYAEAVRLAGQSVEVNARIGYRLGEATARVHLGRAYRDLGERDLALDHGLRAFDAYAKDADQHGMGFALVPLARTCRRFGDLEQALGYCEQALTAYRNCGDVWGQADALDERGCALAARGHTDEAMAVWRDALQLVMDLDDRKASVLRGRLEGAV